MSIVAVLVVILAMFIVVVGIRVPLLVAVATIILLMGRVTRHDGLNVWLERAN